MLTALLDFISQLTQDEVIVAPPGGPSNGAPPSQPTAVDAYEDDDGSDDDSYDDYSGAVMGVLRALCCTVM